VSSLQRSLLQSGHERRDLLHLQRSTFYACGSLLTSIRSSNTGKETLASSMEARRSHSDPDKLWPARPFPGQASMRNDLTNHRECQRGTSWYKSLGPGTPFTVLLLSLETPRAAARRRSPGQVLGARRAERREGCSPALGLPAPVPTCRHPRPPWPPGLSRARVEATPWGYRANSSRCRLRLL